MSTSSLLSSLLKGGSPRKLYREYVLNDVPVNERRRYVSNVNMGRTEEANQILLNIKRAKRRYLKDLKVRSDREYMLRKLRKLQKPKSPPKSSPIKSASAQRSASAIKSASARSASAAVEEFKVPEAKSRSRRASVPKPVVPAAASRSARSSNRAARKQSENIDLHTSIQSQSAIVNALELQLKEYNENSSQRMRVDSVQNVLERSLQDFSRDEINKSKEEVRGIRNELSKAKSTLTKLKNLQKKL
jgi:hypothetical protein